MSDLFNKVSDFFARMSDKTAKLSDKYVNMSDFSHDFGQMDKIVALI